MFGLQRLPKPTNATKVGWIMVAVLGTLGLLPISATVMTALILIVGLATLIFVYWSTTASQLSKTVKVPITHVKSDHKERYKKLLQETLGQLGDVREVREQGSDLVAVLRTQADLATVRRRVKRGLRGLELRQVGVEGAVEYSAMSASGEAHVDVHGHVPPHAIVLIDGLKEPITADAKGQFRATLPFSVVKKVAGSGKIKATYTHQGKKHQIEIEL